MTPPTSPRHSMTDLNRLMELQCARRSRRRPVVSTGTILMVMNQMRQRMEDCYVTKVLMLWLGVPDFLDEDYCYHERNWGKIRSAFRLKNNEAVWNLIVASGQFVVENEDRPGERYFYADTYRNYMKACDEGLEKYQQEVATRLHRDTQEVTLEVAEEVMADVEMMEMEARHCGDAPADVCPSVSSSVCSSVCSSRRCEIGNQQDYKELPSRECAIGLCKGKEGIGKGKDSMTHGESSSPLPEEITHTPEAAAQGCHGAAPTGSTVLQATTTTPQATPTPPSPVPPPVVPAVPTMGPLPHTHPEDPQQDVLQGLRNILLYERNVLQYRQQTGQPLTDISTPLTDLHRDFMRDLSCSEQDGWAAVEMEIRHSLMPHFAHANDNRFAKISSLQGFCNWLCNTLKCGLGRSFYEKVLHSCQVKRQAAAKAQLRREQSRIEHPHGPHEYLRTATGCRYYDDRTEGPRLVPDDAPDRPSDEVWWNGSMWKEY